MLNESNVIDFDNGNDFLTDEDIQSLFNGLWRLVKQKAIIDAKNEIEKEWLENQKLLEKIKKENQILLNELHLCKENLKNMQST